MLGGGNLGGVLMSSKLRMLALLAIALPFELLMGKALPSQWSFDRRELRLQYLWFTLAYELFQAPVW